MGSRIDVIAPMVTVTPGSPGRLDPIARPLPAPTPDISLPKKLGRPPTVNDLIIKRTFDGLTPAAAEAKVRGAFRGTVAAQNENLVATTVKQRVRDMQVALNNVFTPGTPNRQFLDGLQPAKINVLGSLSSSNPVVYQVTKEGQPPKYYSKGWSGGFTELKKAPVQVVMNAEISLEPRGLRMKYPAWENRALSGPITTITEL
ncbi:MAG: hypothetical protein JNM17_13920 [Archangium sp.]|nr:hypothetical protein [Archangium sp.]